MGSLVGVPGIPATGRPEVRTRAVPLREVVADTTPRYPSGYPGVDVAVLNGGLVPGGVYLLAGKPGIGKTTLAIHLAYGWPKTLFVTAEQTAQEVRRDLADRMAPMPPHVLILATGDASEALAEAEATRVRVLVLDSLQRLQDPAVEGAAGSPRQVKRLLLRVKAWAKARAVAVLVLSHVDKTTKRISGPKAVEHDVDAVLWLRGRATSPRRLLVATKSRYGPTGRPATFLMTARGLVPTATPSPSTRSAGP